MVSFAERRARVVGGGRRKKNGCDTFKPGVNRIEKREANIKGEDDGRAAASAGTSADQSGREGIAGAVQQPGDAAPQPGRVHAELHLHLPEREPGKAVEQRDRESRAREAHLAGAGRKYLAIRSAVWPDQGTGGWRNSADAERGIRAVGSKVRQLKEAAEAKDIGRCTLAGPNLMDPSRAKNAGP